MAISISTETKPGAAVITMVGELDLAGVTPLRELSTALVAEGRARLVIDLTQVSFADSAGLGALIGAHRRAEAEGGGVSIVGATPQVRRVLKLTQLDRLFEVCDSLADVPADLPALAG
jgi:anti-anti-sigma factor